MPTLTVELMYSQLEGSEVTSHRLLAISSVPVTRHRNLPHTSHRSSSSSPCLSFSLEYACRPTLRLDHRRPRPWRSPRGRRGKLSLDWKIHGRHDFLRTYHCVGLFSCGCRNAACRGVGEWGASCWESDGWHALDVGQVVRRRPGDETETWTGTSAGARHLTENCISPISAWSTTLACPEHSVQHESLHRAARHSPMLQQTCSHEQLPYERRIPSSDA